MNGSVPPPRGARGAGEVSGLAPGDTIGPYELVFRAAEGGMATIWAARRRGSRGFSQLVAVKVLSDLLRGDPDGRAMFLDEARTAARITHPNVCQVLDYGEDGDRPYMAMEWIEGESLARIAAAQRMRGEHLPLRWVLHVTAAACAGLHAAHEARDDDGEPMNLVHRDVSPQNIMVTWGGVTKVVDFGVAKSRRRAQVTRFGVIKGKTSYFSPEQIRVEELDRRSDIFSFGIMLYVLVTDHHPFRGRCAIETVQNIANKDPFPPREIVPGLPPELDALILRALARNPADRFATAAELGRELESIAVTLGAAGEEDTSSGGVLSARQVGALVEAALPGVALVRRARIERATEILDQARAREEERERAAARISFDEITMEEIVSTGEDQGAGALPSDTPITQTQASVGVPLPVREESTRRGGPVSRTPHPTAIAAPAGPVADRRGGSRSALQALVLLGAAALTIKVAEQRDPGPARAAEVQAGIELRAARLSAQADEALAELEAEPADDGVEVTPAPAAQQVEAQQIEPVRTAVEAPPPAPVAPLPARPMAAPREEAAKSRPYEPKGL